MTEPLEPVPLRFENVPLPGLADGGASFEVPARRAVSVEGPEASGVMLLSRYVLGLSTPVGGRVLVFGEDPQTLPREALLAFRRRLGYLPAGDGLLQNLSLQDNVALPLRFGSDLSEREIAGRLRVMLGLMGLEHVASRRPADATEDERRRAALARALAFDPKLVILEAPFDGLTVRAASDLLELALGGEAEGGWRRTVFVTGQHVPAYIERRLDVRFRIVRGRLEREG